MTPTRLAVLSAVAMAAFAGNSVLNRLAVGAGLIDAVTYALIRLGAGAGTLGVILAIRTALTGRPVRAGWHGRLLGVSGLIAYLFGFSVAYRQLDAGSGALILFGSVQITMFAGAVLAQEPIPRRRIAGALLAFAGLAALVWPGMTGGGAPALVAMVLAGIGWGLYSLAGRQAADPLAATAANFALALIPAILLGAAMADLPGQVTAQGLWLAGLSGSILSGAGYALWYALIPQLGAARAAVVQLTVPVLAAAGGVMILSEPVGPRFIVATMMVLGGVVLATVSPRQ